MAATTQAHPRFILTLDCPDQRGVVAAIANTLVDQKCNILESAQFADPATKAFFMRVSFESEAGAGLAQLQAAFGPSIDKYKMDLNIYDAAVKPRGLVMVSKLAHCLNDLLFRRSIGELAFEIPVIVSNHMDLKPYADNAGIPYVHVPVTEALKPQAEATMRQLIEQYKCDFVVLARYMQILSDQICREMPGRVINIHHSFLPSFKGARPYHQAYARGVKLIGATSHYVTGDLDEGPIIEQEVLRVDHSKSGDDLVAAGRDVESIVLARALTYHAQHRILLHGHRTVVFH